MPSYKGDLILGDPKQFDTAMSIDVERYPRTMIRRPATASSYVQHSDLGEGHRSAQSSVTVVAADSATLNSSGLTAVRNSRTYQVVDENAPGGKRDVDFADLAKGYEYGRTAVHISESDENVTRLETEACLDIIGFIPWDNVSRFFPLSMTICLIYIVRTFHEHVYFEYHYCPKDK